MEAASLLATSQICWSEKTEAVLLLIVVTLISISPQVIFAVSPVKDEWGNDGAAVG